MPARGQLFDREVDFAAAPDVFPPDNFNAGVMVVAPSLVVLEDMLSKVEELPSYDGGDTGEITGRAWGARQRELLYRVAALLL